MKITRLALTALAALSLLAARPAGAVGFQSSAAPDAEGAPLEVAIWYPSDAAPTAQTMGPFHMTVALNGALAGRQLPLIILSHGAGGSALSHYDTAIALAEAGFVVAAVLHTGDNYRDHSNSFSFRNGLNRPRHVRAVIDYMLGGWSGHAAIDPSRIGMLGHSAGGTTALIAIGGKADPHEVIAYCGEHPEDWGCRQARQHPSGGAEIAPAAMTVIASPDPRIKAVVLAAPALGVAFQPAGLAAVKAPVQLWVAGEDEIVSNAALIRRLLPMPADYHEVRHAGHFAFLAPCSDSLAARAPEICRDPEGFDRAAFLHDFQQAAIAFFREHLQ